MKPWRLIILVAAWALRGMAADEGLLRLDDLRAALPAVTLEKYPDADTVLVDDHQQARFQTNGLAHVLDDMCVKVLTEKGKRDQAALTLPFNANYDTVTVRRLEILKPDGRVLPVDLAAQSRIMTDSGDMAMNIYDPNQKLLQITLPGLEIGDAVRTLVERQDHHVRMPGTWADLTVFESDDPIRHYVYEVFTPPGLPLQRKLLKGAVSNTVSYSEAEAEGGRRHRWEASDVPRLFEEPNMPPAYTVGQRVLVSTIPEWNVISRWYWGISKPHLDKITPAMSAQADELVRGRTNRQERLEALFQFVAQKIRYMGITTETEAPGYEPHDVNITFDNRYGVCRDKAALLVALLRHAGFQAFPVLIHAGPRKDEEVPMPWFNHAIVGVREADGTYQLMDPTDENTKELLPAYLSFRSYLVATPEGDTLRTSAVPPAEENLLRIATRGGIDAAGRLEAETTLSFEGINDNMYRGYFARVKPEERRKFFEGLIKRVVPGATLSACTLSPEDMMDVSVPLTARLRYRADAVLVEGRDLAMLSPPWFGAAAGAVNFALGKTGLEQRRFPLVTDFTCGVKEQFDLELDDAVGDRSVLPRCDGVDTPVLSWQRHLQRDGGHLRGEAAVLLKTVEISPEQYAGLKRDLKTIEADARKAPLFAARPRATAEIAGMPITENNDVLLLADTTAIDVLGPRAWRTERTVRKQVLTYAGKKSQAELKINYNPAWDRVELVSASVRTPAGDVKKVAPQEINTLDAEWAGLAPRYPAAKIMVVSLPAVEVGSVIEYTLRHTTSNRPFFAFMDSFQGMNPIVEKTVRLTAPANLDLKVWRSGDTNLAETVTRGGGRVTYTWTARRQPGIKPEDNLPPAWVIHPTVMASAGDWSDYAAEVRRAMNAAAARQPKAAALGRQLAAGAATDEAKVRAIRDYVARQVRQAGPGLDQLPLSAVTPADRTLAEGYGYTADVAVLLQALLAGAGLDAEVVLASNLSRLPGVSETPLATPQSWVFNQALVRTRVGGQAVLLGDTDQYADIGATAHDDRPGLDLRSGKVVPLAAAPGLEDRAEASFRLAPQPDGRARLNVTKRFYGLAAAQFRHHIEEMPPEERRRFIQEEVAAISQSARLAGEMTTRTDVYPPVQEFTVEADRYAVREGDLLYFRLPGLGQPVLDLRADTRQRPLLWDGARHSTVAVDVDLPEGFRTARITPPDQTWRCPEYAGHIDCAVSQTNGTLSLRQDIRLDPVCLPASAYPDLLEANRIFAHPRMANVVLGKDN